jgi:hypothetical protein
MIKVNDRIVGILHNQDVEIRNLLLISKSVFQQLNTETRNNCCDISFAHYKRMAGFDHY